jgi:ABC-2 type transport system ATP-binding protein
MPLPMHEANGTALRVTGVRKSYGTRVALGGVDIAVARGEFVALLGPNGAGKSTLFQLLTGLFTADDGTVEVAGHDLRRQPIPALAAIGVVFQQPTLDLDLTVEASLLFHARLHGIGGREARRRIDAALRRCDLADRAHERARALSGGNRRRVELARALLHEPDVLLMDEATVGLDPASRRQLLEQVLAIRTGGAGVLWATHLVDEAEAADRVVVLHRGEVLAVGTPRELVAEARAPTLAAAFLQMTGARNHDSSTKGALS